MTRNVPLTEGGFLDLGLGVCLGSFRRVRRRGHGQTPVWSDVVKSLLPRTIYDPIDWYIDVLTSLPYGYNFAEVRKVTSREFGKVLLKFTLS